MKFVDHSTVELIKHNASDEDVAYAAWVSNFGDEARERDTDRIEGLINFLYREKHMSPFEHGSFTFFVDTPIFVAREFMRHRTWSYNETSGRYKEMSPRFYLAPSNRPLVQKGKVGAYTFEAGTDEQYAAMVDAQAYSYGVAWHNYQSQLEAGIAKEVARNVLPVATMTQFYATANPRNVMQFLTLRNDKHALKEIRDVAVKIEVAFGKAMPLTYAAFAAERAKAEGTTLHAQKRNGSLVPELKDNPNYVVVNVNNPNLTPEEIESMTKAMTRLNNANRRHV